jgi:hypothetical protein
MSDDDLKFGLEGIEQSQGYEPMPIAHPVDVPEPDHMSEHELAHAKRPATDDWGPEPIGRTYRDHGGTGEELDRKYTVSAEQAAHDVGLAREQERLAREQQSQDDLKFALDQLPSQEGQPQPAQQDRNSPRSSTRSPRRWIRMPLVPRSMPPGKPRTSRFPKS